MNPELPDLPLDEDSDDILVVPTGMPSNVASAIEKYGAALEKLGDELSKQNVILQRKVSKLRVIDSGLDDVKFLLGQQIENYREALDDFETEERRKALRQKLVAKITSPFRSFRANKPEEPQQVKTVVGVGKPKPPKKLSSGGMFPATPIPQLAEGGLAYRGSDKDVIQPGIYDNPTQGRLAPGTAVVPLNRNYGKEILGQYEQQQYTQALSDVLTKPVSVLLGGAVSVYGSILRSLGPLAGYFNQSIPGVISGVSSILGISRTAVISMFGGPAYAGTIPNDKEMKSFHQSWKTYMDRNRLFFPGGISISSPDYPGAGEGKDSGGPEVAWMGGLDAPPPTNPFADTDGEETGIDISLKGKGSNGYGRGLTIRNPWENLYYFSKVPKGFDRAGQPTRGIDGTSQRVRKGKGPSGFGHWATYYIKDSDGKWYELMIGHLDRPAPTWNDTGSGVKLNKGVKIGVQGASGSSVGNTPEGTYDHMTTHINSGGRNRGRAGQLLIQWARDLDAFRPEQMPQQPPIARLQSGGWIKPLVNYISKFTKPKGLSVKGVQAGFTGMSREGFNAIMGGDKFRIATKPSLIGKGSRPVLGHGAYSAPTAKGASRYVKPGGGIIKSIVPASARRISFIEPQAVVPPAVFDKGKALADKLLSGQYSNSPLANKLRNQLITGTAQNVGIGFAKTFGKALGVLNAPVVGDMLFPEPTAPGTLDYARSQGLLTPEYSRRPVKTQTIQMPSTPSVAPSSPSRRTKFVQVDIPTDTILKTTQMRRI